jgi:hypothetical protein
LNILHLLGRYAWLLGDGVLFAWAIYELMSLRTKPTRPSSQDDEKPPP